MDCLQILLNTFFAFLSAVMGVLIGNWYTRRQLASFRVHEKQMLRDKLIKAFQFNIDLLNKMSGQLSSSPQVIPDYRLDTDSVSHILFHGRDLFVDPQWFDRFNWERYQLSHVNAKLDYLNDITNLVIPGGNVGHTSGSATVANQRLASLVARLPSLVSDIQKLIAEFGTAQTKG